VSPEAYFEHEFAAYLSRKPGNRVFTIIDQNDVPIGMVNFFDFSEDGRTCEVGIVIGEVQRWGRGYGREALSLLLDYLTKRFELGSVVARILASNERSHRLFARVGFQYETEITERNFTFHRYRYRLAREGSRPNG
jgi:RimJ/RimL family protein N-acetyltransferase